MQYEVQQAAMLDLPAIIAAREADGWTMFQIIASPFQSDFGNPIFVLIWKK